MDFNVVYNIRTKYIYEKMPKMQIFHMLHAINVHQTIFRHAVYYVFKYQVCEYFSIFPSGALSLSLTILMTCAINITAPVMWVLTYP